jgi:hypothetical protein
VQQKTPTEPHITSSILTPSDIGILTHRMKAQELWMLQAVEGEVEVVPKVIERLPSK